MSLYEALLAIHILAAVTWVGSNIGNNILAARRLATADSTRIVELAKDFDWFGTRILVPTSLILLASGFGIVAEVDGYELGDLWIALALAGFFISFVLGAAYLGPQTGKFHKEVEAAGGEVTAPAQARLDRILLLARLELVMLILIVIDMTIKPGA
jgi:uncharacterized membrane protein